MKDVNGWVSGHTNQMIPSIVDELPPTTVMMLINAVYFEGKWQTPFVEEDTYDDTFHGTNGDATVPMMHLYGERFSYIDTGLIKGITLPYDGSSVVMKVFLPSQEGDTISALFDTLSNDEKQALINSLDTADYKEIQTVQLPKFTDEQGIDGLDNILKNLGIRSAYTSADFSKIADDIAVSSVSHRAKVIVDENGTKAAAVTDIMIAGTAAMETEETYTFIVDRPFVYVIEDQDTGMILFVGRGNDLVKYEEFDHLSPVRAHSGGYKEKAVSASNCRHRFFFIKTAPYILEYNEFRFPIYNPWYEQYICHVCDY